MKINVFKRFFIAYSGFFNTFGHISWFFGVIFYPILGSMLALWLAMAVSPFTFWIPLIPPLIITVKEDMRRRKAELFGLKMISGKRIAKAREEYIKLIQEKEKGGD